jgi:hypothetical protein
MDPIEHIMQFFAHAHLPPHLAAISAPFGKLADDIIATCPRNPERTVALRKLLEAKDAAVRALVAK